ncbi:MAG: phosphatidylserine decarboxylase family protein [Bacteroidia bacterium]|nr:phosphatidylserine decarboxylase family protein [Bacteroidia bacterium]
MAENLKKVSSAKIHKEGYNSILVVFVFLLLLNSGIDYFIEGFLIIKLTVLAASIAVWGLVVYFFRVPKRVLIGDDNKIYAPADGKVVVIENVFEKEYFNDYRKQVSIFMSPLNVHINWVPVNGKVQYLQYHPGTYMVAWKPKASEENERFTTVFKTKDNVEILMRQIAGKLARRIVSYASKETEYQLNEQIGIIKFGSRVDVFLPTDAKVMVNINQKVTGNKTQIAEL